jgi:hypothetical protein
VVVRTTVVLTVRTLLVAAGRLQSRPARLRSHSISLHLTRSHSISLDLTPSQTGASKLGSARSRLSLSLVSCVCLWDLSASSDRRLSGKDFPSPRGGVTVGCMPSRIDASGQSAPRSREARGCRALRLRSHVVWNARELQGSGATGSYPNMLGSQVRSTTTNRSFRSFLGIGKEPEEVVCGGRTKSRPAEVGRVGGGRSGGRSWPSETAVRIGSGRTLPLIFKRQKQARSGWTSCASRAVRLAPAVDRSSRAVGNLLPQRRPIARLPNKDQTASRMFARSGGPLDRRHGSHKGGSWCALRARVAWSRCRSCDR